MLPIVRGWVGDDLLPSPELQKLVCQLKMPFQSENCLLYTDRNDPKHGTLPPHLGAYQMCHRVWPLTHLVSHVYGIEGSAVQLQHVGLFQLVCVRDNLAIDPVLEHPAGGVARIGDAPGGNNTS